MVTTGLSELTRTLKPDSKQCMFVSLRSYAIILSSVPKKKKRWSQWKKIIAKVFVALSLEMSFLFLRRNFSDCRSYPKQENSYIRVSVAQEYFPSTQSQKSEKLPIMVTLGSTTTQRPYPINVRTHSQTLWLHKLTFSDPAKDSQSTHPIP